MIIAAAAIFLSSHVNSDVVDKKGGYSYKSAFIATVISSKIIIDDETGKICIYEYGVSVVEHIKGVKQKKLTVYLDGGLVTGSDYLIFIVESKEDKSGCGVAKMSPYLNYDDIYEIKDSVITENGISGNVDAVGRFFYDEGFDMKKMKKKQESYEYYDLDYIKEEIKKQ